MPLTTVQTWLKGVLDQTPLPGGLGPLNAYIAPPNPGDGAQPGCYIWGAQGVETRGTLPRAAPGDLATGGQKKIDHRVDLWLIWLGPGYGSPNADSAFPSIVDAVMAVVRNAQLYDKTQYVVDPVTGYPSGLLDTGEEMEWEYGQVKAVVDQRYLVYTARVTVRVEEWFQA